MNAATNKAVATPCRLILAGSNSSVPLNDADSALALLPPLESAAKDTVRAADAALVPDDDKAALLALLAYVGWRMIRMNRENKHKRYKTLVPTRQTTWVVLASALLVLQTASIAAQEARTPTQHRGALSVLTHLQNDPATA